MSISIHVFRQIPEIVDITQEQLIQFMLLAISGSLAIIFIRSRIAFDHIRKQSELQLRNSEESLREAQIIASLGSYVLDIHSGLWEGSDMLERLFGIDKAYDHSASGWEALIHPDDCTMIDDYLRNEVLGQGKAFDKEYRIIRQNDQAMRWVHGQGKLVFDTQGNPLKMLGTVQDITERKQVEQELRDSENRYRNLVETTSDLVWEVDENAVYTYASPRAFALTGYQPTELIGTTPFQMMAPEEAKRVASLFTPLAAAQQPIINLENTRLHKDGHPVVFESSGVPVVDADGKLCGYRGIDRDITKRKQAEQTAMDERNFSNTLIASQPDVFFVLDLAGRFIRWNDKVRDVLGYSDAQLTASNALDVIHEVDRPAVAQKIQEAFEQGAATIDARVITKTGIRDYVFSATSADADKGKYLVGVGTDFTERKQMETELRESELAYRTLSQNLPGMVYRVLIREGGQMQFYNDMPVQITGYAVDELTTGKVCSIEPLIMDEDRAGVETEVMRAIAEKRAFAVEYRLKHKDGGIRWLAEHGMPVYGADGAPLYIDGVIFDITEHKQDEIKLQLFRTLIDNSSDAIEVLDPVTLHFLDVNETQCRELGYSRKELMSMSITDIDPAFNANLNQEIEQQVRQTGGARFESVHRRKDGSTFPVEVSSKLVNLDKPYVLNIVRDITERKRAEAEVQELQEQLREQALQDPLTGLYNRRYLEESMGHEIIRAERNGQSIGIVMCDLDHFKRVNDTYGHLVGDEVLKAFAELLRSHSRGSDIVCRFGGEEFLLMLPDMSLDIAYKRAEQLRASLAAKHIGKPGIQVTASFGVAAFPVDGKTQDTLISAVDTAMYQAKEAGRNRVVVSSVRDKNS